MLSTLGIGITWLAWAIVIIGLGRLPFVRASSELREMPLLQSYWMGLGMLLLGLQVWHLAAPVTEGARVVVILLGGAGWALTRRMAVPLRRVGWPTALVLVISTIWIANRAAGPLTAYDSGMYHLSAIRWAESFSIVPGLANLHSRLGFNNSSLLLGALLDAWPWSRHAHNLLSGLFFLPLWWQGILAVRDLRNERPAVRRRAAYEATLLVPLWVLVSSPVFLSSLTTDGPAAALVFAGVALVLRHGERADRWETGGQGALIGGLMVLIVAPTIKLSVGVLAWSLGAGFLMYERSRAAGVPRAFRKVALAAATFAAVTGTVWSARSVVLSGYPVYPWPVVGMPVAWRVPEEQARAEISYIGHFARAADEVAARALRYDQLRRWEGRWVVPWVKGMYWNRESAWFLVLVPSGLALVSLTGVRRQGRGPGVGKGLVIGVPLAAALAIWLVSAPRPSFGISIFWMAAATGLAAWASSASSRVTRRLPAFAVAAIFLVFLGTRVIVSFLLAPKRPWTTALAGMRKSSMTAPGDGFGVPNPSTTAYRTSSGLTLLVPSVDDRCWDAGLLCTPHPAPNLRLRREGRLGSGFQTDGRWLQERYPTRLNPHWLDSWRRAVRRDTAGSGPDSPR